MNRFKIVLATMVAMICVVGASAQTAADANAKYTAAAKILAEGKTTEAIPMLEEAMNMALDADAMEIVTNVQKILPSCYYSKGLGLAKAGKLDDAAAAVGKAAELAELYGNLGVMNKAKAMTSKLYTMMAANAFNAKDYAKAAEIFSKGYEANPKDTNLASNLAMSYLEMKPQNARGYEIYKNVIALEKTSDKYAVAAAQAKDKYAYYKLLTAKNLIEAKNVDSVLIIVNDIIAVDSMNATAYMTALQVATNAADGDKVIAYGDKAIAAQKSPEAQAEANYYVGAAYQNKENKDKAIEYYKKVLVGPNAADAKKQIEALSK